MKNSSNLSADEYFNKFCEDERAVQLYFDNERDMDKLEIEIGNLEYNLESLQEQYDERDSLCMELIALLFKLENCRTIAQVREKIKQHRMDRYADYV